MELRHLEYFVAVAEELSFTRASRRLHVVQSGVSSGIQGLERELGTAVFERDRHRVVLTDAGRALLPEARATLAAARTAADAVAEVTAGLRGTLSIGTMISTGTIDVPTLLGLFHEQHPGVLVRLRMLPGGSAELAREVSSGGLDLALLSLPGDAPGGLTVRPLALEPLLLVCGQKHPLADTARASGGVTLSALAEETFIDFPVGWGTRAITDRAFAAAGVDRLVAFDVPDYGTAAALVRNGLGVAFLPASIATDLDGVEVVPLTSAQLAWPIQVAIAATRRPSAAARAFLADLLAKARPELPGDISYSLLSLVMITTYAKGRHHREMSRSASSVVATVNVSTGIAENTQGAAAAQLSTEDRPGPGRRRHQVAFWLVAYTFAVTMAFSALPTPLYVLYEARDGFSTFMTTVIFSAYAAGVVGSLFLAGHLSDWAGRRRMALLAVATNMVSGVLFLIWPATAGLIVARVVSGLSIGMLTATATAYLSELHGAARPGARTTRSEIVATAANLGGLGLGPLLSGLLAQYAGHPLVIPYLVAEALMLAGAIALTLAPETARIPERRPPYRPQRVSVPAAHRPTFLAAAATGGVAFAVFGIFTSVSPSMIADILHDRSHAVAGVVAFAVFGAAAAAQIVLGRSSRRAQAAVGLSAVLAGLAMVTAAVWLPSFWLLVAGGIIAGGGAGAAFRGMVGTIISITPAEVRGEGLAGLFLGTYLGMTITVVGVGVATLWASLQVAVLGFAILLAAVITVVARRVLTS